MATRPIVSPNSPCSRSSVAPYCERVRTQVTPERWAHVERVAILAETIARANDFSEDEVRATALAAVLHDAARDLSEERLLALAPPANATERAHPITLHGRAARALAVSWGVTDERVLNAIEGHVYGVPPGDGIGMAVYVADVSEPGRGVNDEIRELAMRNLPRAYRRAVRGKVDYLRSRGKTVHPRTLEVHDQILADAT
jgi:predicted HD superfamily hydrolase involved in NAD metabolism